MASKSSTPSRSGFRCVECGWRAAKWVGRCGECQAWGTLVEDAPVSAPRTRPVPLTRPAQPIGQIDSDRAKAFESGVAELDRVLGGGFVPGAVILLAGEPGIGKSTLLTQVAARCAHGGRPVLYITGEESAGQVRLRAERTGTLEPNVLLAAEQDLGTILTQIEQADPQLLIVDSVQTISSADVDGIPGALPQVREVANCLIRAAKQREMATILVGHVTKDGTVAGPRTLEHLVDVLCQFEGDRHAQLRILRALKNRYGPTDEIGCFEMTESGMQELADPSGLFLSSAPVGVPGTCITVTLEGRRPLAAEIQALVVQGSAANPRRACSGLNSARMSMMLAVMQQHLRYPMATRDVYLSTVGGVKIQEPAADLAMVLACGGALRSISMPPGSFACGEVGLAGEVRPVPGMVRRLTEAWRLGLRHAFVPDGTKGLPGLPADLVISEVGHVEQAIAQVQRAASPRPTLAGHLSDDRIAAV